MKYVIGIDSGGTHYRVRAVDLEGNLLGELDGRSCSHYRFDHDYVVAGVKENIARCLELFGGKLEDCVYLVCGSTGVDSDEDQVILEQIYGHEIGLSCPVRIYNDAELALLTVTGGEGILLISGTGSIACGYGEDGTLKRAGGWPEGMGGDEGSGRWVYKQALRYLGRYMDGLVPDSPVIREIMRATGVNTRKELCDLSTGARDPVSSIGPGIDRAADMGDPGAIGIMQGAAGESFSLLKDMVQILGWDPKEPFTVAVWGSNIVKSATHFNHFAYLAQQEFPRIRILRPSCSAAEGATLLALDAYRDEA